MELLESSFVRPKRGICFSLKVNSNGLKTLDSGTAALELVTYTSGSS